MKVETLSGRINLDFDNKAKRHKAGKYCLMKGFKVKIVVYGEILLDTLAVGSSK